VQVFELSVLVLGTTKDLQQFFDESLQKAALGHLQVLAQILNPRGKVKHAVEIVQILQMILIGQIGRCISTYEAT